MKDYLTVVEFAAAGITKQAVYKRKKDYIKIADMKKTLQ